MPPLVALLGIAGFRVDQSIKCGKEERAFVTVEGTDQGKEKHHCSRLNFFFNYTRDGGQMVQRLLYSL